MTRKKHQIHAILLTAFIIISSAVSAQKTDTTFSAFFEVNAWKPDSLQIDNFGKFLQVVDEVKEIVGYADSTGQQQYNLNLSRLRASAIADILKKKYNYNRPFSVYFRGEEKSERALWLQRRVDITGSAKSNTSLSLPDTAINGKDLNILKTITADNIFFLPDLAVISQESLPYVEQLAGILKTYPNNSFEIVGHVNYQSRLDSFHLQDLYELSRQRARAVYDLLIEHGIPKERLRYKGVGNSQPLFTHPKNEAEKRKNMRVEVLVLE